MKSIIAFVVFIFCVQSVRCDSSETLINTLFTKAFEGSPTREELIRIVNKCDFSQVKHILKRYPQNVCSISKRESDLIDINNFLKLCVDSGYHHAIDSILKVSQNVFNIICESSDEYLKELNILIKDKLSNIDRIHFFKQIHLQASSCVFSENEVMKVSKTVDTVLEFYVHLIKGHEQQCGVVKRIQQCIMKNKLNGSEKVFVERIAVLVDLLLKSFDCKFDVGIDERTYLDVDDKTPMTLNIYQEQFVVAFTSCETTNLEIVRKFFDFQVKMLSLTSESVTEIYETICDAQNKFNYLNYKFEIEALKECIKPSYVVYVDKINKVIRRQYDFYCSKKNQTMDVATEMLKESSSICLSQNLFRLVGCFFSSGQIKDIIEDKNLVSNFTTGLLDGNFKECGTIDKINHCVIETIDGCNDDSLAIIINHGYDATKNMFGCNVKPCKEFTFKNFDVPFKKC